MVEHGLFATREAEFEGLLEAYRSQRSQFRDKPIYGVFRNSQLGKRTNAEDAIDAKLVPLYPILREHTSLRPDNKIDRSLIPLDAAYKIRKEVYDDVDRKALLESMYYADAFAIIDAIQKTDKQANPLPLNQDNAVFAEFGLTTARFLRQANDAPDHKNVLHARTFEAFSNTKRETATAGTLWYTGDPSGSFTPTPQHYAEYYAELLAEIPADKRGNEVDFTVAFLSKNLVANESGWKSIIKNEAQRKEAASILGIDDPNTLINDDPDNPINIETFYHALINGLNDDAKRTLLIKFIDNIKPPGSEQQKIVQKELNIIGNARRLYIYANVGYDYLQSGKDQLTGDGYKNLKDSVIASEPDFTNSIEKTETSIKNNQNFRIPVTQNAYLIRLGKYLQDNADKLALTGVIPAGASDADLATYTGDLLDKIHNDTLSTGTLKFTTSFLSAIRRTNWLKVLLNAPEALKTELKTKLGITADPLTEDALLTSVWENRASDETETFFNTTLPAEPQYAEVKAEFNKIKAMDAAEITKLQDYVKLGKHLNTGIPEASASTNNIGSEEHKAKVKTVENSLRRTNQANRITELLHLINMLEAEYESRLGRYGRPPEGATPADVERSNIIREQRLVQLSRRRHELLGLLNGKNLIRAGDVSFGTLLAGIFGPHAHTAAHKAKDGSIWSSAVARLEGGMLTYRAKIKLPDGTETTKLVDAYDPDFWLGSSIQTFLLNNDHVNHEAIYKATLQRHQYLMQNDGYIIAYDEAGANPDELGRFTTSRSNYYLTMQDYNTVFNSRNLSRSICLDIFITAYAGLPLLGLSAAFIAVTYALFLPALLFGGEKWGLPALKFNPFNYLMEALWFTPHQKAEITLSRQVTDIFFEKMQADIFSDIYVLSPSSDKFLQQFIDNNPNNNTNAVLKARDRYNQLHTEFNNKVEEHLRQKHANGANVTDDERNVARRTILMKELGMTEQQYTEMKRQCISKTNENDADKNKKADKDTPGPGIMLPGNSL